VFEYEISGYKKIEKSYNTGSKPIGVRPVNNKLYITNYGDNSVSEITK
jgi:DNA-binding beta-propeller fold protein YncE